MTTFNLDFSELRDVDDPGFGLQSLIKSIGIGLGMKVLEGGRGADKGRDLFFTASKEVIPGMSVPVKVLVNCKDRSKSGRQLKFSDIEGFHSRAAQHGCNGFLLATTVPPTDDLVTHVEETSKSNNLVSTIWQPDDIKAILLEKQDTLFRFTIARFFPSTSRDRTVDYFHESLERMDLGDALELSLEYIQGVDDPVYVWETIDKLLSLDSVDIFQLNTHFRAALALNNRDLTIALTDAVNEALLEWSSQQETDWEEIMVKSLKTEADEFLRIEVIGSINNFRMGEVVTDGAVGTIRWTEEEFELVELSDEYEQAEYIDYLCELESQEDDA